MPLPLATRFFVLPLLAGALLVPGAGLAQDESLDNLAQELIRLRSDVEALHSELERKRENYRTELRSLASQKAELEASQRRESLSIEQLEENLAEKRQAAREAGVAGDTLRPVVTSAIEDVRARIEIGMPFKRRERLSALDELDSRMRSGAITPQRAVNRLWGFYEDELRLTRENGIYSQVIPLGGDEVLVDVARLGMVMMFFRTKQETYGFAINGDEGWRFERVSDSDNARRIETLFDSLGKQIRTGFFTLPNPGLKLEVR